MQFLIHGALGPANVTSQLVSVCTLSSSPLYNCVLFPGWIVTTLCFTATTLDHCHVCLPLAIMHTYVDCGAIDGVGDTCHFAVHVQLTPW